MTRFHPYRNSNTGVSPNQRWREEEICSVIFGCTHLTFSECIDKQLFGLPDSHFNYVKMVKPGMPLFLFNYSTRQLCGLYVATSHGTKNLDLFAWTGDSWSLEQPTLTRYPAQARARLRDDFHHMVSVEEKEFRPLIAENYYGSRKFYFDLNASQTLSLVNKFEVVRDSIALISEALKTSNDSRRSI